MAHTGLVWLMDGRSIGCDGSYSSYGWPGCWPVFLLLPSSPRCCRVEATPTLVARLPVPTRSLSISCTPSSQALVVFQSSTVPVSNPGFTDEVTGFMNRAKAFPDVTGVSQGAVGIDGKTTYVTIDFSQDASIMQSSMARFRSLLPTS